MIESTTSPSRTAARSASQKPLPALIPDAALGALIWLAAAVAMVVMALALGADANWDLRNYHYYNGFAHLYGGLRQNLFPAQFQSWHNATFDMFDVALIRNLSPRLATIGFTLFQSLNAPLVFIIALQILTPLLGGLAPWQRLLTLFMATLVGMTGPMTLSEVGTTFVDNMASVLLLAALAALGHVYRLTFGDEAGRQAHIVRSLVLGGIALGAALGTKLTNGFYVPAFAISFLWLGRDPMQMLKRLMIFGGSAAIGLLLTDGAWAFQLWRTTGSPVFPIMNGVFRSPWLDPISNFDERFQPHSWMDALLFPFRTAANQHPGAELNFRDLRLVAALFLFPLALIKWSRSWMSAIATFYYVSTALWLSRFGIERFALPLEMTGGPLFMALIGTVSRPKWKLWSMTGLAALLIVTTIPCDWGHVAWDKVGTGGNWFDVVVPAALDEPGELFLMTDDFPSSYVIPFFRKDATFVRIQGNINPSPTALLAQARLATVAEHKGPIFSYGPGEPTDTQKSLLRVDYGLVRTDAPCIPLPTNIETLVVCPLEHI